MKFRQFFWQRWVWAVLGAAALVSVAFLLVRPDGRVHVPGHGFSVLQLAAGSRDGLPVGAVLRALSGAPLYRTDRLGSIELIGDGFRFAPLYVSASWHPSLFAVVGRS